MHHTSTSSTFVAAIGVILCSILPSVVAPTPAAAQGFMRQGMMGSARFVDPPRALRQKLRQAREAIDEKRYSEAIVTLGDLAAGSDNAGDIPPQDYVMPSVDDEQDDEDQDEDEVDRNDGIFPPGFRRRIIVRQAPAPNEPQTDSFLKTVRDMIGDLPSAAADLYRLRYDAAAQRDFDDAAARGDLAALAEVRRKYFHTDAGYRASAILAADRWAGGHAIETMLLLDDVVTRPRAVTLLGDNIVQLHSLAMATSGRSDNNQRGVDATVLPSSDDQYHVFGGRPSRNGGSDGQFPLANLRFDLQTTASPRQTERVEKAETAFRQARRLPPPSWIPLRVGNQLLVRTTERLLGVDYETGKTIWTYPWLSPYEAIDEPEPSPGEVDDEGSPDESILTQRVWNDVPYGHVSSDNSTVYMIDNLEKFDADAMSPMMQMRLRGNTSNTTTGNTLVALELATEGKLLWRRGRDAAIGAEAEQTDPLSESFFLGVPLSIEGRLYAMVETAGDINLICLDPATGQTLWQQVLVSVETGSVENDRIRRIAGAMCSYHEGVLVCPTGAGAMVAFDLRDRVIRWAWSYPRNQDAMMAVQMGRMRGSDADPSSGRWDTPVAMIDRDRVLVTATESDRLLAVDLVDGHQLFAEKSRVQVHYLAGIRDDKFLLVGPRRVLAFDIKSGASVWSNARGLFEPETQICGRGVFGTDCYFVPTTDQEILKLSLADGSLIERRKMGFPLGNLVVAGGEIISQGPTSCVVAYGDRSLRPIVDRQLEADPNNFSALVRRGELALLDGDREGAMRWLARARAIQPDDVEVQSLSVQAMLASLRETDDPPADLIDTLDRLITADEQRIEFIELRLQAAIRAGDPSAAMNHLLELSDRVLEFAPESRVAVKSAPALAAVENRDDEIVVTHDTWLAARAEQIFALLDSDPAASPDDPGRTDLRSNIGKQMIAHLEPYLMDSTERLKRRRRHMGSLVRLESVRDDVDLFSDELPSTLMVALSRRLAREASLLDLERIIFQNQPLSAQSAADLPAAHVRWLADRYELEHRTADAERLQNPNGAANAADDSNVFLDWPEHVRMKLQPRINQSMTLRIDQSFNIGTVRHGYGQSSRHISVAGRAAAPLLLRYPSGDFRSVNLGDLPRDDPSGRTAVADGGVMLSLVSGAVVAMDMYSIDVPGPRMETRWSLPIGTAGSMPYKRRSDSTPFGDERYRFTMNAATAARGMGELAIGPIVGDRFYLMRGGRLAAVDVLTGSILWQRSTTAPGGNLVANADEVGLINPTSDQIEIYSTGDGHFLRSNPWTAGEVWQSAGPNALTYTANVGNGIHQISLIDAFSPEQTPLLQRDGFPASQPSQQDSTVGFGRLLDGRLLVMMDSEGKLFAWDILTAYQLFDIETPPIVDLHGMRVIDFGDRLAILAERRMTADTGEQSKLQTKQNLTHRTVHDVMMVSRDGGDLLWTRSFDRPWGCTVTQPAASPLLVFSRSPYRYGGGARQKSLDVLALRVDDGREAGQLSDHPLTDATDQLITMVEANPARNLVVANVGTEIIQFQFSNEAFAAPTADEPNGDELNGDDGPPTLSPMLDLREPGIQDIPTNAELELELMEDMQLDEFEVPAPPEE